MTAMIGSNVKVGDQFKGTAKKMTLPRLLMFSGGPMWDAAFPKSNIHTDDAFAKSTGLPGLCAAGTQYQAALAELMIDLFGDDWLSSGTLAVKLVDLVMVGQTVQARATVTKIEPDKGSTVVHMDIWSERDDGAKVLVGTASGRLPR